MNSITACFAASLVAKLLRWHISKLLCMPTLSFRLRFQPGIVFFQEPNVHQAAGLSLACLLESDAEGLSEILTQLTQRRRRRVELSCPASLLHLPQLVVDDPVKFVAHRKHPFRSRVLQRSLESVLYISDGRWG